MVMVEDKEFRSYQKYNAEKYIRCIVSYVFGMGVCFYKVKLIVEIEDRKRNLKEFSR